MATKYDPVDIVNHGRGMVTVEEANRIPDDACVYSQNEEIGSGGAFGPRKGCSIHGQRTSTDGKILSTTTMRLRSGFEIPLRLRVDATPKGILEWYNVYNNSWELLVDNLSATARVFFLPWNTSSEDRVYCNNGVDDVIKWKGITSRVVSNTAVTLDVVDATDFAATGTVVVDGTQYAYTGKAGNQLTGLVGLPAFAVDKGVAMVATTIPAMYKSNIGIGYASRYWIGIGTGMFYSKAGNPEDFTYSTPRVVGDGGVEDFPEGGGSVRGFGVRDEKLVIMKPDILRTFEFDRSDVANEFPVSKPLGYSYDIGPYSSFSVTGELKEVYYVSRKGGLRQLTAALTAAGQPTQALDVLDLFEPIRPTLKDLDFTDAACVVFEKKILVACKSSSDVTNNDIILFRDTKTNGIGFYTGWQVNDWFIYGGSLYFAGSSEPNTFKCFDGYVDDTGPITVTRRTKRYDFGAPSRQKEAGLIYIEGLIGDGTDIEITIRLNENGEKSTSLKTIEWDGAYVIRNQPNTMGSAALGTQPLGGTIEGAEELNTFRVYLTLPVMNHYNMDLIIQSTSLGGRYKILTISPNPKLQEEPPANLKI